MYAALWILLSIFWSVEAFSLSGMDFSPLEKLEPLPSTQLKVELHPNTTSFGLTMSPAIELFNAKKMDLHETVRQWLDENHVHPLMRIQEKKGFHLRDSSSHEFEVLFGKWPACNSQLKATVLRSGKLIIGGLVPNGVEVVRDFEDSDFGLKEDTSISLRNEIQMRFSETITGSDFAIVSSKRCVIVDGFTLAPAWDLELRVNHLLYRGIGNSATVYSVERRFFDATTATVSAYGENSNDAVKDFTISNMRSLSQMTSSTFETETTDTPRAHETNLSFVYDATDPRFPEASVFAHAHQQYEFFKSLGFTYSEASPILLKVNATPSGTTNNAVYLPASVSGNDRPQIQIGAGDGDTLQNLLIDADVVGHELGHHFVYKYLTSTMGASLSIHEGLADFFALARKGNPCLGETICPSNAPGFPDHGACWIAQKCLRTAENTLKLGDLSIADSNVTIPENGHIRGQVVSGLLWDLRKNAAISENELNALVYRSVTLLLAQSGYRDLILALITADEDLYSGQHCQKIMTHAIARGFGEYISDVQCSANGGVSLTSSGDDSEKQPKGLLASCGTIGGQMNSSGIGIGLMLLTPLVLLCRRKRHHDEAL